MVKNRNIELGARGVKDYTLLGMNHNINWNASAYAGRNFNDIIFIGGNRVGTGYFRNVGNTQRMGTELGLNGKLGNKLSWYGNYSYVRATFETSQNISSAGHSSNPFECDGAIAGATANDQDACESSEGYQIGVGPERCNSWSFPPILRELELVMPQLNLLAWHWIQNIILINFTEVMKTITMVKKYLDTSY